MQCSDNICIYNKINGECSLSECIYEIPSKTSIDNTNKANEEIEKERKNYEKIY